MANHGDLNGAAISKLNEIRRQLDQVHGYPFDPVGLNEALRVIAAGEFDALSTSHELIVHVGDAEAALKRIRGATPETVIMHVPNNHEASLRVCERSFEELLRDFPRHLTTWRCRKVTDDDQLSVMVRLVKLSRDMSFREFVRFFRSIGLRPAKLRTLGAFIGAYPKLLGSAEDPFCTLAPGNNFGALSRHCPLSGSEYIPYTSWSSKDDRLLLLTYYLFRKEEKMRADDRVLMVPTSAPVWI
ncbi:MAG: hypothetical protein ABIJ92_04675 [Candidatus Aenigmatarchaeota archaeon]